MKPRIYLETTIPSYLTSFPSRDLVVAGHQQTTRDWWDNRRVHFELFISQAVIDEVSMGDQEMVKRRLEALKGLAQLDVDEHALELSERLITAGLLPRKAQTDALHIALATVNGMDYLITWNCKHIANAAIRRKIESVFRGEGYEVPLICTPEELL